MRPPDRQRPRPRRQPGNEANIKITRNHITKVSAEIAVGAVLGGALVWLVIAWADASFTPHLPLSPLGPVDAGWPASAPTALPDHVSASGWHPAKSDFSEVAQNGRDGGR